MFNVTYSSWRDEDVVGLMPSVTPLSHNSGKIDVSELRTRTDIFLGKQLDAARGIYSSHEFQQFEQKQDPHALAVLLERMEVSIAGIKQATVFSSMLPLHYSNQSNELIPVLINIAEKVQGIGGCVGQIYTGLVETVAKLDDKKFAAMFEQEPKLNAYKIFLEKLRKSPSVDHDKVVMLNVAEFSTSLAKLQESLTKRSDPKSEQLFAEGLTGFVNFKQKSAEAQGFKDTLAAFSYMNSAPHDMIDTMATASAKYAGKLSEQFHAINAMIPAKLDHGKGGNFYSWEEAKDIVCCAYAQLDPGLGTLARKAFDEGWILARYSGIPNPMTLPSVPEKYLAGAHPFAAINFSGVGMDVLMLGHEMAHVLSNHIAGQKHGAFTVDSPTIVQESFSHFGEALLEQEMIKRADTLQKKAHLRFLFLAREFDTIGVIAMVKFEEELYRLVREKGEKVTFENINNLYKHHNKDLVLFGGDDIRSQWQMIAPLIMLAPHSGAAYPVTKIMAAALYDEYEASPQQFRKNYQNVMEAGGTIGVTELWDTLLGKGKAKQLSLVEKRMENMGGRLEELRKDLEAMPDLAKKEDPASDNQDVSADNAASSHGLPILGPFTGKVNQQLSEDPAKPAKSPNKSDDDWRSSVTKHDSGQSDIPKN